MKTGVFVSCVLLLSFALVLSALPTFGEEAHITLVYSSNTLGEVDPSCWEHTQFSGGLARRAQYIKEIRQRVKNFLLLDGGDALATEIKEGEEKAGKTRKRAELILKIYETIGYDALNVGNNDLTLGVEYLKALQEHSKIPFLSANIREKTSGKPVFTPYLVKEVDGLKIGIIGLVTTDVAHPVAGEIKNYFIEDPAMAALEIISGPTAHCDHIIALAHLNPSEIESIAQIIPRLSIIIGGDGRSVVYPREIDHAIWVQADAFGLSIGRLNVKLVKGSSGFVDVTHRNLIQNSIDETQKKIEDPHYVKEVDDLKRLKEMLIEQKKKMPDGEGRNTYENRFTLLHPGVKSDPEIEELIISSRSQVKKPIPW